MYIKKKFQELFYILVYSKPIYLGYFYVSVKRLVNPTRMERVILVQEVLDSGECYML